MDNVQDYRSHLHSITIPTLFIAGRQDYIVPADRVWAYYTAIGSLQKQFLVLSKANGFSENYGHLGYSLGKNAKKEVYPLFLDWLTTYSQ